MTLDSGRIAWLCTNKGNGCATDRFMRKEAERRLDLAEAARRSA